MKGDFNPDSQCRWHIRSLTAILKASGWILARQKRRNKKASDASPQGHHKSVSLVWVQYTCPRSYVEISCPCVYIVCNARVRVYWSLRLLKDQCVCFRVNYYIRLLGHLNANNIRIEIARIMVEQLKRMNAHFILRREKCVNACYSFSNLSVTTPTSQLILQLFRRFTYVTAHSPTLPLLHLRHSSFFNPSFTSPTSQTLHLIHLVSRPCSFAT